MKVIISILNLIVWLQLYGSPSITLGSMLRRIRMQDHCKINVCAGVTIERDDYVILTEWDVQRPVMVNFVNSSIAKIPHLMFDLYPELQAVNFDNCSVETFERPQFEGARNLRVVYLNNNRLEEIPKYIFQGAEKLKEIHLRGNQLHTLHNDSFYGLTHLRILNLSENQLKELPGGVFHSLKKLELINVAGNRLEWLPSTIFERNKNLSTIILARNPLRVFDLSPLLGRLLHISLLDISGVIMHDLRVDFPPVVEVVSANDCDLRTVSISVNVASLQLRNNSLREVPQPAHPANVSEIDLSLNPLRTLHVKSFRRFTALQQLNLSFTQLDDLPEGIFKKQIHLNVLDISGNRLTSIKFLDQFFDSFKNLQEFHFAKNNWNCDFLHLMINTYVKRRRIRFNEDSELPEFVDDYIQGIACWNSKQTVGGECSSRSDQTDAVMDFAILRNDIRSFLDEVDLKFVKVFRTLEEIKLRI